MPFGFRHRTAELSRRIDPELNSLIGARKRLLLGRAVSHASREFRHFSDKYLILIAPIDNDLIFMHQLLLPAYGACPTLTVLLRRTIRDHLRRAQPEKILNVFQRIRFRFFRACGLASGCTSFASLRRQCRQAPMLQNNTANLVRLGLAAIIPSGEGNLSYDRSRGRQKTAGVSRVSRFLLIHSNSARLNAMPRVLHPHIVSDSHLCGGSPRIEGSRIPVRTIVVYVLHHGTTPEALLGYYPQLSLAAIYDALSYYYDNREEIDVEIAANAALEPPAPSLS